MGWRATSPLLAALPLALLLLLPAPEADALPRQTLMSGAPCSTCHTNLQGGGMRTEIGWYSMATVGALTWDKLGFNWLHDRQSNEVARGLAVGWDIRMQSARVGRPSITVDDRGNVEAGLPERDFFLMQAQPYVSAEVVDWLTLYGTWNATSETFDEPTFCSEDYPGQSCFEVQAIVEPSPHLPAFRLGMLQPSFGIRHDDHTMLIRADAGRQPSTLIPPQYAEWGAEAHWQPRFWLQLDAGVFSARNLSRAVFDESVVRSSHPAWGGRVRLSPRLDIGNVGLTTWSGASVYGAGDFRMFNTFAGLGLLNRTSLLLESAHLRYGGDQDRNVRNLSAMVSVRFWDWLFLNSRVEESRVVSDDAEPRTQAIVTGFEFFPLPYFEIRPEYRWMRNRDYKAGQYTVMLHLFY